MSYVKVGWMSNQLCFILREDISQGYNTCLAVIGIRSLDLALEGELSG